MFRIVRFSFAAGLLLGGYLLTAQPANAVICFFHPATDATACSATPPPPTFATPQPRPGSLLNYTVYAYLEDNINLYPQPNLNTPPVRNVGQGFLYVTIQGQVEANGELWYQVNPGEYTPASGVRIVQDSEFSGVEVHQQPARPFGWILQDVRPSSQPGGEPHQGFAELTRYTFFEVYDTAVAGDGWIWYYLGDGRWIPQTAVSLVDVTPQPEAIGPNEYWVEVDLYEQSFAAYEGNRLVYAGLISSGLNRWPTYEGLYQVWSRHLQAKMSGAEALVDYYFIEDIPYIMYFDPQNEIALHGAYWHDRFGYKHSHGCVNMPPRAAEWVFYWSENAPNDLWVWVHASDPANLLGEVGS
ncbi:MAG: L,D-transpeptidase [Chloroflexi bacterium]|nr:L,D-transpeptidase [Chloroflexota bacterium]